jgi:hypothetical protein
MAYRLHRGHQLKVMLEKLGTVSILVSILVHRLLRILVHIPVRTQSEDWDRMGRLVRFRGRKGMPVSTYCCCFLSWGITLARAAEGS